MISTEPLEVQLDRLNSGIQAAFAGAELTKLNESSRLSALASESMYLESSRFSEYSQLNCSEDFELKLEALLQELDRKQMTIEDFRSRERQPVTFIFTQDTFQQTIAKLTDLPRTNTVVLEFGPVSIEAQFYPSPENSLISSQFRKFQASPREVELGNYVEVLKARVNDLESLLEAKLDLPPKGLVQDFSVVPSAGPRECTPNQLVKREALVQRMERLLEKKLKFVNEELNKRQWLAQETEALREEAKQQVQELRALKQSLLHQNSSPAPTPPFGSRTLSNHFTCKSLKEIIQNLELRVNAALQYSTVSLERSKTVQNTWRGEGVITEIKKSSQAVSSKISAFGREPSTATRRNALLKKLSARTGVNYFDMFKVESPQREATKKAKVVKDNSAVDNRGTAQLEEYQLYLRKNSHQAPVLSEDSNERAQIEALKAYLVSVLPAIRRLSARYTA